jgi:ribose-phosphate pyrophosphokinase
MKYLKKKYPDGSFYVEVEDFSEPIITERINSYEDLFFIKSIKEVCDFNGIKDVELFIPCMFQQQHDRRFFDNQSFELKIVCDFINSCNFSKVYVFHPHSDSTQMGLNNIRVVDNSKFISSVLSRIDSNPILFSTDAGSFKWINKLVDKIGFNGDVYCASKSRDLKTHDLKQVIDCSDFGGRDILVLDDLCVKGGTFIGLLNMLKERNVGKIYLAVSHMTIQDPNTSLECYDKIFTTNSKYDYYVLNNLELIDYKSII